MKIVPKYKKPKISDKALPVDYQALKPSSLNSYDLPKEYRDLIKLCRYCDSEFVVAAKHQKYLYEVAKRHIATQKVLCEKCRHRIKDINALIVAMMGKIGKKGTKPQVTKAEVADGMKLMREKFRISGRFDSAKYSRLSNLKLP